MMTTDVGLAGGLSEEQRDRAVSAVLASAVGDALGSAYEFGPELPDSQVPVFGVGHFGHAVGEWTDDTAMAIAILEAAARRESLCDAGVLAGVVDRWLGWAATAKDVGIQTQRVFSRIGRPTTEAGARQAAQAVHRETGRSAGNGSLMRTGPVALAYLADGQESQLAEAAGRIAQLTHVEPDNVHAVTLWCLAIRQAIRTGQFDPRAGLPWLPAEVRSRWSDLIDEATAPGRHPRDFAAQNGWVVKAFQAALAAIAGASGLREALYRAVRGGNDTDTVAAIAGSLAGAVWGASQLPADWLTLVHGWPGYTADDLKLLARQATLGEPVVPWKLELRAANLNGVLSHLWAELDEHGDLRLHGQDLRVPSGPAVRDGEYEYVRTIREADLPKLIELLGGRPGDDLRGLLGRNWRGDRSFELERLLRDAPFRVSLHVV
ncbi:MAG: ADP-ribosylglycohydrolase family protein [Propionibacteriaceae bacterium]|nr:ADP-ribosylglycohydrolase family protein [Propionibacteriaceae bacterium]